MSSRSRVARRTSRNRLPAPRPFRSLLVPIDLTASADRIVGRVAQLPVAPDVRITLLYVLPDGLPARTRRREEVEARVALESVARSLARQLPSFDEVRCEVRVGTPATEIAACAIRLRSQLLVMGAGSGDTLRQMFIGSTVERVIRRTRIPVLAVRLRPSAPYRHPAIAIDAAGGASKSVMALLRLLGDSPPPVDAIHAFETPYGGLIYRRLPSDERPDYLEMQRRRALRAFLRTLADAVAGTPVARDRLADWEKHVRHGTPRRVIGEVAKEMGTDLLVLGTHAYAGALHALFGTVAGDVLRSVKCDVLVVPCRRHAS